MIDLIQYKCKECNKSFFLLDDEVEHSISESRHITCPYNGKHKNIIVTGKFDNIKEVMEEVDIFKRRKGRFIRID